MSSLSTAELKKALSSLEESLNLYSNSSSNTAEQKAFRDACIQRFEYCVELSWKVSVKIMGSNTAAAKIAIREMARNNLITSPQTWFDFIEARNETSHSYDEDIAKRIFSVIKKFPVEAQQLLLKLEQK